MRFVPTLAPAQFGALGALPTLEIAPSLDVGSWRGGMAPEQRAAYEKARKESGIPPAVFDLFDLLWHLDKLDPAIGQQLASGLASNLASQVPGVTMKMAQGLGLFLLGKMSQEDLVKSWGGKKPDYLAAGLAAGVALLGWASGKTDARTAFRAMAEAGAGIACAAAPGGAVYAGACAAVAGPVFDALWDAGKNVAALFDPNAGAKAAYEKQKELTAWTMDVLDKATQAEDDFSTYLRFFLAAVYVRTFNLVELLKEEPIPQQKGVPVAEQRKFAVKVEAALQAGPLASEWLGAVQESGWNAITSRMFNSYRYYKSPDLIYRCYGGKEFYQTEGGSIDDVEAGIRCSQVRDDPLNYLSPGFCGETGIRMMTVCAVQKHMRWFTQNLSKVADNGLRIAQRNAQVRAFKKQLVDKNLVVGVMVKAPGTAGGAKDGLGTFGKVALVGGAVGGVYLAYRQGWLDFLIRPRGRRRG